MTGFVYEWICIINGKKYIGSHKGNPSDGYIGSGLLFSRAVKKFGIENFIRNILYVGDNYREEETRILKEFNAAESTMFYNLKNEAVGGSFFKESNGMYNKSHTDFSKSKISKTIKQKYLDGTMKSNSEKFRGSNNPMFGRNDHCVKMVEKARSNSGKNYEEIFGEEQAKTLKKKLSKSQTGKKHNLLIKICPHCGKEGAGPNMTRFHFDKCSIDKNEIKIDNRKKKFICPHCDKEGANFGNMHRWHFENCKMKEINAF